MRKIIYIFGLLILTIIFVSLSASADYNQNITDSDGDIWDYENEKIVEGYAEIDLKSIVTTKTGPNTIDFEITFEGDIPTDNNHYLYHTNFSDGKENSEHYVKCTYVPYYDWNIIEYKNEDQTESVNDALTINGDTISGTIVISKCNIPEYAFSINLSWNGIFDNPINPATVKFIDDYPNGSFVIPKGYKSTVEIIDANEDEHENDIKLIVEYHDGGGDVLTVEGAEVNIYHYGIELDFYESIRNGLTDEKGEIIFENFVPADYRVNIKDDNYKDYNNNIYTQVLMDNNEILNLDVELRDMNTDGVNDKAEVLVFYGLRYDLNIVDGADVYLNGEFLGQTEKGILSIDGPFAEGNHSVKVEYNDDYAFSDFWIKYFLKQSHHQEIKIELKDDNGDGKENDMHLWFYNESEKNPQMDAEIYFDGKIIGSTDINGYLHYLNIEDGYHELNISYNGSDYFEYLLIGIYEIHTVGDYNFDGEENDLKIDVKIGGYSLPDIGFYHYEYEDLIFWSFTKANGIGYTQDIQGGAYTEILDNARFPFNQTEVINFNVAGITKLKISTDLPNSLESEEHKEITITIYDNGSIPNADVTIETKGSGLSDKSSGKTDENGNIRFLFSAKNVTNIDKTITIWINSTKDGYTDGKFSKTIKVIAWIPPLDLQIETDIPDTIISEEQKEISITVSSNEPLEDAEVSIEIEGSAEIDKSFDKTDENGTIIFTLTAQKVTDKDKTVTIWINATKDGYEKEKYKKIFTVKKVAELKKLAITHDKPDYFVSKRYDEITIIIKSENNPSTYIDLTIDVIDGEGEIDKYSGKSDKSGTFKFKFTAPKVEKETENSILVKASKKGYENNQIIFNITIKPQIIRNIEKILEDGGKVILKALIIGEGDIKIKSTSSPDFDNPEGIGIYLDISLNDGNLEWCYIKIIYDNIPEKIKPGNLKLYYWNDDKDIWVLTEKTGVETLDNYVWANVTHLTIFAPRDSNYNKPVNSGNKPDLHIKSMEFSDDKPKEGDKIIINITIENLGTDIANNISVKIYVDDKEFVSKKIDELIVLGINNISIEWKAKRGEHTINVIIDEVGNIDELDERNNLMSKFINVKKDGGFCLITYLIITVPTGFCIIFKKKRDR